MKSIKPGRGPSFMGGIIGIAVALFGVFWTVMTIVVEAWFMTPFGLIFIVIAIINTVYNFKNATGKNRYSQYDITDEGEEPDPWDEKFGTDRDNRPQSAAAAKYCPYCGEKAEKDYKFCSSCGRELP